MDLDNTFFLGGNFFEVWPCIRVNIVSCVSNEALWD